MIATEILIALASGVTASVAGGALGAMLVGGKDIGYELAAMMGAFYGPVAGIAGVIIGLIIVTLI